MKTRFLALTMGALMITGAAQAAQPAASEAPAAAPAPLAPPVAAKSDTMETLTLDGRFKILVKGLDDTSLTSLVKATPNLTIFAPTDAAFNALPADELAKAQADKATMQQLLLLHMVNAPLDSSKIKGVKGPVPTVGSKPILLDGSDDNVMKVGGADIIQADVKPAKGLIQVVDHVLVADTAPATPAQ